jgi:hypothetical protein
MNVIGVDALYEFCVRVAANGFDERSIFDKQYKQLVLGYTTYRPLLPL